MRVMVTGGTGFVGYHTTRALIRAGHQVRLLVRSEEKLKRLFGGAVSDHVLGDITDARSVEEALAGCDAVVHSAAFVSIDQKDAEQVMATNVDGARLVIGGAVARGLQRILHVSSVTALYDRNARFLNEFSPPGTASDAYGQSKVACENYVRELQAAGHPVHISYPASVIGPDDPGLTEANSGLRAFLGSVATVPPSGNQWVDVRDVAAAHLALIERDLPPGRYPLGGHFLAWSDLVDTLGELTGRRIRKLPMPARLLLGIGRAVDWLNRQRDKSLDLPVTHEAMVYATHWVRMDSSKSRADLGLEFRPLKDTLADTVRWLAAEGHLDRAAAGRLLDD